MPIGAGGGAPGLLKGAGSAAAEAVGAAALAAAPDAGTTIFSVGFALAGRHDGGRLHAAQLGQHRLGVLAGRGVGLGERLAIEIADPFRLLAARDRVLMRQDDQSETPRLPLADVLAAPQDLAERGLRGRVLLLGGDGEPIDGEADILLDAVAVQIEARQPVLRLGIAEIARGMAEQVNGVRRVRRKRHGGNAVDVILAERDERLGGVFGDRARRADIGLLVGDLLEIGEGLGVVLRPRRRDRWRRCAQA